MSNGGAVRLGLGLIALVGLLVFLVREPPPPPGSAFTIVTSAGIGARDSNREGRAHDTMTLATTSTPRASPNHHFPKTRKKLELPDCLAKSNAVAAPTSAPTSGPTTTAEVT